MRIQTPLTGAEREIMDRQALLDARYRGRAPERTGHFGVLKWDVNSVLPPNHPLADTPAEARRKRVERERRRRGL